MSGEAGQANADVAKPIAAMTSPMRENFMASSYEAVIACAE